MKPPVRIPKPKFMSTVSSVVIVAVGFTAIILLAQDNLDTLRQAAEQGDARAQYEGVGCGKGRKDTLSVEGPLFVVPQSFLHRPWVVAGVPDKHFFVVACCDASSRPVFSRQRFTKIHKISFYDKLHLRQRFRDCKDITP